MLSAGRAQHQARHIWIALGCSGHVDAALSCSRELSLVASGAATVASHEARSVAANATDADVSGSHAACFSGRSEPASCGGTTWPSGSPVDRPGWTLPSPPLPDRPATAAAAAVAAAVGLPGAWRSGPFGSSLGPGAPAALAGAGTAAVPPLGRRCYHSWYYGSKLRSRAILSISSLDQLGDLLRQDGDKLDHINLTVFLKQLQLLASHAAAKTAAGAAATGPAAAEPAQSPAAAAATSAPAADGAPTPAASVATAVAAASSRATEAQVQLLAAEALRLVRKRSKWYDPRNAASVVLSTASLGYTDGRVLHDLTARTVARLTEAYSRDLLLLLRGLHRHAQLSAAARSAGGAAAPPAVQPDISKPWWQRVRRPQRYWGPPAGLLEGVERFMVAKIPTGKMPPENVDGLLRYLRELPPGRPVGRDLLTTAEADLRTRLAIYAPEPLAGVLSSLASERHPLPPDLLDAAAAQFAAHADKYGSGPAAARFLTAATALAQSGGSGGGDAASSGSSEGAASASAASASASAGSWLASRPELLAQCLRLMSKDLPRASPERLVAWMTALNGAEVPLASLASVATATLPPSGAAAPAAAAAAAGPIVTAPAAASAAAAAAFVRAHGAAVESARPRLSADAVAQLRKAYDAAGLPYPKGL